MTAIEIVEVGARDGLQNEKVILPTSEKLELIRQLMANGARRLEVASFVDPKRVPQMADAQEVVAALPVRDDVTYIGLVLNKHGALRAIETQVHELGYVVPLSESFGMRNQGKTPAQCLEGIGAIAQLVREAGRRFQVTLSVAWGCPFDGDTDPAFVVAAAKEAASHGPVEIALADTIGVAAPAQVASLVAAVREAIAPVPVRVHFHDTRHTGLANVWAAIGAGALIVDSSVGGLGGCPFAPGAAGNIATEDVIFMLERSGISTGLDLAGMIGTAHWLEERVGHKCSSALSRAPAYP